MNRGVEIDSDVADGPFSVILNQVTNGVAVRMAVLYLLSGGKPELAEAAKSGGGAMSGSLLLRGGRVIDPSQSLDGVADVLIVDGRDRGDRPRVAGDDAEERDGLETIDCSGLVVSPGLHRRALSSARAGTRRRRDDRDRRARRGGRRIHRGVRDAEHRSGHRQSGGGRIHHPPGVSAPTRRASIRSARSRSASGANRSPSSARWSPPARSR